MKRARDRSLLVAFGTLVALAAAAGTATAQEGPTFGELGDLHIHPGYPFAVRVGLTARF